MAPSPDGSLIASACVAKSNAAALIWVWDTKDWKGVAQLPVGVLMRGCGCGCGVGVGVRTCECMCG